MPFARLNRFRKTIGARLSFWYALLFIVSSLILFGLAYLLVSKSIERRDRDDIQLKLQNLAREYRPGALEAFQKEVLLEEESRLPGPLFIRVAGPNGKTLFLNRPREWDSVDLSSLEMKTSQEGAWIDLPEEDHHRLEIASLRMADGIILQVGKSTRERDELLEGFRGIFAGVTLPIVLFGVIGGAVVAFRALRPIRDIIATVESIEAGQMKARVPVSRTGDELDELGQLFNRMLGKIETLIGGMKEALDNVAHDLRTPMTRLRGVAEMALRKEEDPEVYREALIESLEESERILTLLNTLMDISEAETGTLPLHREPVNLVSLMEEAVDLYRHVAEEKTIAIEMKSSPPLISAVDASRRRQVFPNLIDNVLQYNGPGGRVDLEASREGDKILIRVKDTGVR